MTPLPSRLPAAASFRRIRWYRSTEVPKYRTRHNRTVERPPITRGRAFVRGRAGFQYETGDRPGQL